MSSRIPPRSRVSSIPGHRPGTAFDSDPLRIDSAGDESPAPTTTFLVCVYEICIVVMVADTDPVNDAGEAGEDFPDSARRARPMDVDSGARRGLAAGGRHAKITQAANIARGSFQQDGLGLTSPRFRWHP